LKIINLSMDTGQD
jgi:hypothetical protein